MWNDNESDVDLLGFDVLVDSLDVLLTEPALLPLTVGVIGDWGSGKSSLMNMAARRLSDGDEANRFIVVRFNPWRFEDHVYVKYALITAVLDAIEERLKENPPDATALQVATKHARRARRLLHRLGLAKAATAIGASQVGLGPEESAALASATHALTTPDDEQPDDEPAVYTSVAEFHNEFESLVDALGADLEAIVVLIDDMDRCATDTIIDTFETIRLFLNAPKTSYVIGAHEAIIAAALEGRFPARTIGDEKIGRHYLEKMLQTSVHIPPLSEPEVLSYVSLLYAERHLGRDNERFARLVAEAAKHRRANELDVAMNVGIARGALGDDLPPELAADLAIAERIGSPLAQGLRGNPRQIKRFLNRLQLRMRVSQRRGLNLDAATLAKLMVLEETHFESFERLFHWQTEQAGVPAQLSAAEALVRDNAAAKDQAVAEWAAHPDVKPWLAMDPPLAGIPLGPYFTFSRDRMRRVARASKLTPELQALFERLRSNVGATRTSAVKKALKLDAAELADLGGVMLDQIDGDPSGPGTRSLIEIAADSAPTANALMARLTLIPGKAVTPGLVLHVKAHLASREDLPALFARWRGDAPPGVKKALDLKAKKG